MPTNIDPRVTTIRLVLIGAAALVAACFYPAAAFIPLGMFWCCGPCDPGGASACTRCTDMISGGNVTVTLSVGGADHCCEELSDSFVLIGSLCLYEKAFDIDSCGTYRLIYLVNSPGFDANSVASVSIEDIAGSCDAAGGWATAPAATPITCLGSIPLVGVGSFCCDFSAATCVVSD